jgi:hypothetical protein
VEKYNNFYGCKLGIKDEFDLLNKTLNFIAKVGPHNHIEFDQSPIAFEFAPITSQTVKSYNTYVVHIESGKIYIPPGELYGDYEKMFLPFDLSNWIAIGVIIFVSSSAIVVIKRFSSSNEEIYFGKNNPSPLMEFISIIINGSQHRRVTGNAPRIFLLTFIFWSLIFRLGLVDS